MAANPTALGDETSVAAEVFFLFHDHPRHHYRHPITITINSVNITINSAVNSDVESRFTATYTATTTNNNNNDNTLQVAAPQLEPKDIARRRAMLRNLNKMQTKIIDSGLDLLEQKAALAGRPQDSPMETRGSSRAKTPSQGKRQPPNPVFMVAWAGSKFRGKLDKHIQRVTQEGHAMMAEVSDRNKNENKIRATQEFRKQQGAFELHNFEARKVNERESQNDARDDQPSQGHARQDAARIRDFVSKPSKYGTTLSLAKLEASQKLGLEPIDAATVTEEEVLMKVQSLQDRIYDMSRNVKEHPEKVPLQDQRDQGHCFGRFGDGDGSYWDRWLTTKKSGIPDGGSKPFVPPRSGFKRFQTNASDGKGLSDVLLGTSSTRGRSSARGVQRVLAYCGRLTIYQIFSEQ